MKETTEARGTYQLWEEWETAEEVVPVDLLL